MSNLSQLAAEANKAHAACERAANSMLRYAREAGEALIKAKQELAHGQFGRWIEENCRFGSRMARKYMLLANGWDELAKRNHGSVLELDSLSMREALKILSSGGPEEIGDFFFVDAKCPACGKNLARTSAMYVTCVECFDCKLHYAPSEAAMRRMGQLQDEQARHQQDICTARRIAQKATIPEKAELLLDIGRGLADPEGIGAAEVAELVAVIHERVDSAKRQDESDRELGYDVEDDHRQKSLAKIRIALHAVVAALG